ncbi:hypothetical protein DFR48_104260 [Ciceribacter lividus]|uniref:Uncharacterized protein n=1 Tax=Ciceribacter lividus TaxID=1197950 RepID=A0A6I7HMU4_9HYPH|nr:hypothetical protein DFR48_104260 [Ciceribacter lividus]
MKNGRTVRAGGHILIEDPDQMLFSGVVGRTVFISAP